MRRPVFLLVLLALFTGCGKAGIEIEPSRNQRIAMPSGGDAEEPGPRLAMIAVRPAYARIQGPGKRSAFRLHAWWDDGRDGDVDAEGWTSEDVSVVSIDAEGGATAVAAGEILIRARFQGEEAFARVVVDPLPPEGPPPSDDDEDNEDPDGEDPPCDDDIDDVPDDPPPEGSPYADRVVSYAIGEGGGFNEDGLPGVVLGPPKGLGLFLGSYDVFSLGVGGEIVLEFTDYVAVDGAGVDFIVFENAFQVGGDPDATFAEPGVVSVSEDGKTWVDFPCCLDRPPYVGCAGVHPTLANPDTNEIDPTDPTVAGGDAFDLGETGLKKIRFVKIQDSGLGLGPIGPGTRGFDLDAIAIVHGALP